MIDPRPVVRDRVTRTAARRLDPTAHEPITTTGRHPFDFAPGHIRICYQQDGLTAIPGRWDVTVEISGPRVLRDHTLSDRQRKRRVYDTTADCPEWAQSYITAHHPDFPHSIKAGT